MAVRIKFHPTKLAKETNSGRGGAEKGRREREMFFLPYELETFLTVPLLISKICAALVKVIKHIAKCIAGK